jgi:hypothetical protein
LRSISFTCPTAAACRRRLLDAKKSTKHPTSSSAAIVTPTPIPARAPADSDDPLAEGGVTDGEPAAEVVDAVGAKVVAVRLADAVDVGGAENVTALAPALLTNCHVTVLPMVELTNQKWQKTRSVSFALFAGVLN